MTATLRRQIDYRVLRLQYRLDGPWLDRVFPWIVTGGLFVVLALLSLAHDRELGTGTVLGSHIQGMWMIRQGHDTSASLAGVDYLANQASFVLWPLAQLTRAFPTTETLLMSQSFALAAATVPIWRLARTQLSLRIGPALALVVAYSLHPTVHQLNLADFHPEVFAVPALLGAVLYSLDGRIWHLAFVVAVVLASRADLGLAVAGLGLLLVLEGRQRMGTTLAGVGLAWAALAVFAFQPALGGGAYPHLASFAEYGDTPFTILRGMVSNPLEVLGDIGSHDHLRVLVLIIAPFVFLPLAALRYLLPAVPITLLYFIAQTPEGPYGNPQLHVPLLVFSAVAAVFAMRRLGRKTGIGRVVVDRSVVWVMMAAALVVFLDSSPSSLYERPWDWGRRDVADGARLAIVEQIPPTGSARVSPSVLPLTAERLDLTELDTSGLSPRPRDMALDTDVIVFDENDAPAWSALQVRDFLGALRELGFDIRSRSAGIWLLVRAEAT